ncbi:MAG: UPF0236 family transposase-like protein [Lutisporaceae bacterium]
MKRKLFIVILVVLMVLTGMPIMQVSASDIVEINDDLEIKYRVFETEILKGEIFTLYLTFQAESKKIITHLGEIEYKRSYYRSRKGKGYRHLLDELLGIDVHERIDQGVRADMTEHAANVSYQKAGELACDVKISRQTVMNGVHKLKELKVESLGAEHKGIETLYIDADEDHISLQSGKKAMPRLIYIHEGIKKSGGRNELINPFYFASLRKNPDALWQEVYEHVEDTYSMILLQSS